MLITLSEATRRRLLQDGYSLAREFTPIDDTPENAHISAPRLWPDDPPSKKNRLVLVPSDPMSAQEWYITSTRCATIGRELPGGPMGDRYGIVCAENDDGERRSRYVLGGGKVQPDFDGTDPDRLMPGEDVELVRGAMVSENSEELRFPFTTNWDPERARDHHMWGPRYFLIGVRAITDRIPDSSGITTTVIKQESGIPVGDAVFIAITHERLGNFAGQKGETGTRYVKPASELLRGISRAERERGMLPMLPRAQATAMAMAIIVAKDIFGKDIPPGLAEVVTEGEREAGRVLERNPYAQYFMKVFQEGPWGV